MKIRKEKLFNNFFLESKNRKIDILILHNIAAKNIDEAIDLLKYYEVSSHYIIDINGEIYQLVREENIAFHAGKSYWNQMEELNKNSIGIEFFNPDPDNLDFTKKQIEAGIKLSLDLKKRYNISNQNIIGHLDVAYFDNQDQFGFLGRKIDPSFRFDWKKFYDNNLGEKLDDEIFYLINDLSDIKKLKQKLNQYGYKINKIDDDFDNQLKSVINIIKYKFKNKYMFDKKDKIQIEIFQDTKNAMQSGLKKKKYWFLKIISKNNLIKSNKVSLQGWNSSDDMNAQLKIKFYNLEEAISYAKKNNYDYIIKDSKYGTIKKKSYQNNFTDPILL